MALSAAPATGLTVTPTAAGLAFNPTSITFGSTGTSQTFTVQAASNASAGATTIIYSLSGPNSSSYITPSPGSLTILANLPTATQAIASAALTQGESVSSFTPVIGGGGTGPLHYSIAPALPSGLLLSTSDGAIIGTPSVASAATSYTVTVTDSNSATATATFSLTVNSMVTATQAISSAVVTVGHTATTFTPVSGGGGTGTLSYSISPSLPAGLALNNASGAVGGTPTTASATTVYTVTVEDTNGATAAQTFSLTVNGSVTATQAVASAALTQNRTATTFTPVTGTGGTGTLNYSVSPSLPNGLTLNAASGAISGTPTVASAATSYTVTITDGNGATGSAIFSLTVDGAVIASQTVASAILTVGHAATAFTPVTATGGTAPLTFGIAPSLPSGLAFDTGSGQISGTPTSPSSAATYAVTATDANGAAGSATFTLTIDGAVAATQSIASSVLIVGRPATAFTPVTGSGGTGALTFAVSPTLPTGLNFNAATGAITGTPAAIVAAATFSVTVSDGNGASDTATFDLAVSAPVITLNQSTLPNGIVGAAYSQSVLASGGTAPYRYTIANGTLPAGLALDATTGLLTGTPTTVGNTNFSIVATDATGQTGTVAYVFTVEMSAVIAVPSTHEVVDGGTVIVDLTAGATGGPFTDARVVSLSPPSAGTVNITLGDTAAASEEVVAQIIATRRFLMTYTPGPAFSGTAIATFTLSSASGTSAPTRITFVVQPRPDPSKDAEVIGLVNAQTDAAKRFAEAQTSNFNDHLEQLHDDGCLRNDWGISLTDSRDGISPVDSQPAGAKTGDPGQDANNPALTRNSRRGHGPRKAEDGKGCSAFANGALAFWTGGLVNFGSMSLGGSDSKFDFTTIGITVGVDYRFNPSFTAGIGIGFNNDESRIGDNGTTSSGQDYSAAFYGSYHPTRDTFVDGLLGYGILDFSSKRFVTDTGEFASGDRNGNQVFASITSGYEFRNDALLISPYGRFSASRSTLDAFAETGADWANLRYGSQTLDSLTGSIGMRVEYAMPMEWGVFSPKARVEYGHDFAGDSRVALSYADQVDRSYNLTTDGTGSDYVNLDFGADFKIGHEWTFGLDYGATLAQSGGSVPQEVRINIGARF
jgi:uncharacterized protein YhjY with autotransporter beta-barrel domain